jgi:hypothetical protein
VLGTQQPHFLNLVDIGRSRALLRIEITGGDTVSVRGAVLELLAWRRNRLDGTPFPT